MTMEKIVFFESYMKNTVDEISDTNIINLLNELSKIDPKCLSEDDFEKLTNCLPLSTDIYNEQILAAGCNVIASLCSNDLARHYFGEKITLSTVNILKSLLDHTEKEKCVQECMIETCRAIGNLCYYHEENTKLALKEECLLISMKILETNNDEKLQSVIIGLLLNLTHLDGYNYEFPDNMIEELNSFGIQYIEYNNILKIKPCINLILVMINIAKKSSSNSKLIDYEKYSFIDHLLEESNLHTDIASICVKFIKQVSKIYKDFNWILKGKHKILVQLLDKYEENQEENARHMVNKICDIIILLSNDDGSMDNHKQFEVIFLVEWLLLKAHSNNLYVKLSAVRSLGNFSRYKYDSNNINPAITIIKHLPWFINNLEKAVKNTNSLMVVSILCMFKNLLYVTNFESLDENEKSKLIKTTIEVLVYTTFNPIIMKCLEVIDRIIKKGGINQNCLVMYKDSTVIKLVTTYCNSDDEDLNEFAKKLLYSIENISTFEIDILHSVENVQIKD